MKIVDEAKKLLNLGKKDKVKYKPLTAKDISENCMRIQAALEKTPVGTAKFDLLTKELKEQRELLRKYKDSKFYVEPKVWVVAGGTTIMVVFFVALAREYPMALKIGSLLLKAIPFKGI